MTSRSSHVAVIIVTMNAAMRLRQTLESLHLAKTEVSFSVHVLDNCSSPSELEIIDDAVRVLSKHRPARLTELPTNLGFAGGNNVGIGKALADPSVTHLCLLNPDVIVTDFWLDRLLEHSADAVSCLSNAVGNEQTIPPAYDTAGAVDFECVNAFAQGWHQRWKGSQELTTFLGFFLVLLSRDLVTAVGRLDERFFPGAYEDDDYCERIRIAGFPMLIARDVYVHHFGSSSFGTLPMKTRVRFDVENRARFEAKYGRPWKDRTHLSVQALRSELAYLFRTRGISGAEKQDVARYLDALEAQVVALALRTPSPISDPAALASFPDLSTVKSKTLVKAILKKHRKKLKKLGKRVYEQWQTLQDRIYRQRRRVIVDRYIAGQPFVLILSSHYPSGDRLKDGYFQRVKWIDERLSGLRRVYLTMSGSQIPHVTDGALVLRGAGGEHNAPAEPEVLELARAARAIYWHSINPAVGAAAHLVRLKEPLQIWDVHGAVPEEGAMMSVGRADFSPLEAREHQLASRADVVISVSRNMGDHLRRKYPWLSERKEIVLPVAPRATSVSKSNAGRTGFLYAGGTQVWQCVPRMFSAIAASPIPGPYSLFSPDIDVLWRLAKDHSLEEKTLTIDSLSPDELNARYDEFAYGFVLRERSVVNRVASPTKLIEYLRHGIVPIMNSPDVGDFDTLGLTYVPLVQFIRGEMPDEAQRVQMAEANGHVLDTIASEITAGSERLASILEAISQQATVYGNTSRRE